MAYVKLALISLYLIYLTNALPTSILEEIKTEDIHNKKVKRGQTLIHAKSKDDVENTPAAYYPPMKRAGNNNLKADQLPLLTEWDQERYRQLKSPLFASEDELNEKTLAELEKGYQYGINKEKLNEALENAILKTEAYGEPAALNQYRYYGVGDERKRRRRRNVVKSMKKREIELNPDEILAILTLMEEENERNANRWNKDDGGNQLEEHDDEDWYDAPVYPHALEHYPTLNPNYYYDTAPPQSKHKRFMVAKRGVNDPTRTLRFLNGPSRNDFYTLSELLANQRAPNLPVHQRFVL